MSDLTPRDIEKEVLDLIGSNPKVSGKERETSVYWAFSDESATLFSAEPAVIRRFLPHPHIQFEELGVYCGTTDQGLMDVRRYDSLEAAIHTAKSEAGTICQLKATLPIGLVSFGRTPRQSNGGAQTVTMTWRNDMQAKSD